LSVLWLCCCLISTSFCYNIVSRNGLNQLAGNGRRLQNSGCRKPVWISNIYYTASVKVQFSCSPIGQKRNTGRSKKRHVHYMLWWGGNRSTMKPTLSAGCPQAIPSTRGKSLGTRLQWNNNWPVNSKTESEVRTVRINQQIQSKVLSGVSAGMSALSA
jgi:hypothetical protein